MGVGNYPKCIFQSPKIEIVKKELISFGTNFNFSERSLFNLYRRFSGLLSINIFATIF
jgi:hypothetical protein